MAVTKSSLVDDIGVFTDSHAAKDPAANYYGRVRTINGNVAVLAADIDAVGDRIVLCRLPIDAVVLQIRIANDDLDSGTDILVDLGLYEDVEAATAKASTAYASALTQFQAAAGFTDVAFEARNINENGQFVYQDAGDATREDATKAEYFLAFNQTATVAGAVAGDIAFQIVIVVD